MKRTLPQGGFRPPRSYAATTTERQNRHIRNHLKPVSLKPEPDWKNTELAEDQAAQKTLPPKKLREEEQPK